MEQKHEAAVSVEAEISELYQYHKKLVDKNIICVTLAITRARVMVHKTKPDLRALLCLDKLLKLLKLPLRCQGNQED